MNRYACLVNVGSICGLILVCGILVPKDTACVAGAQQSCTVTVPPVVHPVVLADGMWSRTNSGKDQYCRAGIIKQARDMKVTTDERTPDAKRVYWDCMLDSGGAL